MDLQQTIETHEGEVGIASMVALLLIINASGLIVQVFASGPDRVARLH